MFEREGVGVFGPQIEAEPQDDRQSPNKIARKDAQTNQIKTEIFPSLPPPPRQK
jgi:hypothetical protein